MCRVPRRAGRHRSTALVPVLLASLSITPAVGMDVPETATSRSLLLAPDLVDHEALAFAYPHRVGEVTAVELLDTSSASPQVILGRTGHGLAVQSSREGVAGTTVQLGFRMGAISGWRIGVAASGAGQTADGRIEPPGRRTTTRDRLAEVTVGTGGRIGDSELDLAVRVGHRDLESSFGQDDVGFELVDDEGVRLGVRVRWALGIGNDRRLRAFASWRDQGLVVENQVFGGPPVTEAPRRRDTPGYDADAGLVWISEGRRIDRILLGVSGRLRDTIRPSGGATLRIRTESNDEAAFSVSIEEDLFDDLRLLMGVRRSYQWNELEEDLLEPDGATFRSVSRTERTTDAVAWGLRGRWRGIEVTGTLSLQLDVTDAFGTLDVRVPL